MFGRKCSLCGGRLNSHKICQECGLDNSKSEKYYQINRSSCDNRPLTHVHEEDGRVRNARNKPSVGKKEKKGKGCLTVILIVFCIGFLIPLIMGIVLGIREVGSDGWLSEEIEMEDPYEHLDIYNEETNWWTEFTLTSGEYVVGVHIPAGDYVATMSDDYDSVEVSDPENSIYLYEYLAKEEGNYLDDLRLFEGAVVTITTQDEILLQTGNAQAEVEAEENPIKKGSWISDKENGESYIAGIDFKPGVYDLFTGDSYGSINMVVYDETGDEEINYRGFDIGTEAACGEWYKNLVIPEGAVISIEDVIVEFTPSPMIQNTDYFAYYDY